MNTNNNQHSVIWGSERIDFRLRRSDRRTLGITVHPDLGVLVMAPRSAAIERILGKVGKRANWIREQQRFFREFLPKMPPRRYVSGETHRYLGRQYRLKVVEGGEPGVKLKGRFIWISVPQKSSQGVRRLVERWYLERAKDRLSRSFDRGLERMGKVLAVAPALRIRRMLKRWGSWTRRSGVCLNPELVKAPGSCIDYVVIHELCHAVHGHHGKEFYDLQRRIMPDWEQRKARLEQVGAEAGIASEMKTY